MPLVVVNFIAFQAGWFACVLGGARGEPWLGVWVVAAVAVLHAARSPVAAMELRLLAAVAALGAAWDSLLVGTGVLVYPSGQLASMLAPVWIVALWIAFATSLNVSLRWLKGRYLLAALLGALFAPLSFWGGARMGAVRFPDPVLALAVIGAGWALLMPLVVWLGERFDGWAQATRAASGDADDLGVPHAP